MTRPATFLAATAVAGLALAGSAQAQNASLYGLLDMSAGSFQNSGATKVFKADSGNMTTSFLGFKGTEDLGGGMKAVFKIEHFLRLDKGAAGRFDGDAFWARNAYVGLSGDFGTSQLGRNTTPLFVSTLLFNAFGDSFGFSPSIRQLFTPSTGLAFFGDTGWNNSILYASPKFGGGFSGSLIANLGEGAAGATGKNFGGNLYWFGGPFGATFAFQQVKNGAFGVPAGWKAQDSVQLGGSYDFGVAKAFAQYTQVKTKATVDTKTTLYSVGVKAPVGPGNVIAQYGSAKADLPAPTADVTNKTLSVGYDYFLSKTTDVYFVYMNDKLTNLKGGNTLAAGIKLVF